MHKRQLTPKEIQEAVSQQTHALHKMDRSPSFWLDGVHYPSKGEYLEYVVRYYLRAIQDRGRCRRWAFPVLSLTKEN